MGSFDEVKEIPLLLCLEEEIIDDEEFPFLVRTSHTCRRIHNFFIRRMNIFLL